MLIASNQNLGVLCPKTDCVIRDCCKQALWVRVATGLAVVVLLGLLGAAGAWWYLPAPLAPEGELDALDGDGPGAGPAGAPIDAIEWRLLTPRMKVGSANTLHSKYEPARFWQDPQMSLQIALSDMDTECCSSVATLFRISLSNTC